MSASSNVGSPAEITVQTAKWVLMIRRADCDEDGCRIGPWGVWDCVSDPIHPHGMAIRLMRRLQIMNYASVLHMDTGRRVLRMRDAYGCGGGMEETQRKVCLARLSLVHSHGHLAKM